MRVSVLCHSCYLVAFVVRKKILSRASASSSCKLQIINHAAVVLNNQNSTLVCTHSKPILFFTANTNEHFTMPEPPNSTIACIYLVGKRRPTHLEVLKLWNVRSGCILKAAFLVFWSPATSVFELFLKEEGEDALGSWPQTFDRKNCCWIAAQLTQLTNLK